MASSLLLNTERRHDFPIVQNCIYLDSAATSQKPNTVIEAMSRFYREENANVHRSLYTLSVKATMAYERAREIVAQFIGAESSEVIFTKNTTEALNLLAYSLGRTLQAGDEIVLSEMEHHSNLVPWQQLAKQKKLVLKFIPLTSDYRLDMAAAKALITPKTKVVSLTHQSNVLGTINPVTAMAELAHQHGSICIVDAAQSIGHMPIDVKRMGCDFLVFSGHKMCGPTGIGVLYGKKELLENLEPFLYGGDMIREVTFEHTTWNDVPWKFEAGTPPITEAIGLAAAIEYLTAMGLDQVRQHDVELTSYALEQLNLIPGLQIIGPSSMEDRGAVISFILDGIHPHDIAHILDTENIAIRGGTHCAMPLHTKLNLAGTSRISLYLYNTKEDINALIQAIQKVISIFQKNQKVNQV